MLAQTITLSLVFILHGFDMPLPIQTDFVIPDTFYNKEAQQYAIWLKESIKTEHDIMRINRIKAKQEIKQTYDTKHHAKQPDFKIGELVLLKGTRIAPGSNKNMTKKPYVEQPHVVKQIVFLHGAGPSYKLKDEQTGKDLRGVISHDKLKHYFSSSTARNQTASVQRHTSVHAVKAGFKRAIKNLNGKLSMANASF